MHLKLITAFLFVTALSVAVVAYFSGQVLQTELTKSVGTNLHGLAQMKAQAVSSLLSREIENLEAFGLSKVIQDRVEAASNQYTGDPAAIQDLLAQRDQQWRAARATDPLVQEILSSAISAELQEYRDTFPDNVEVFVTDRYGALIAASNRTSDYYQADEAWWTAAYNHGQGAVYIGQPEFDQSSDTNSILIAVPLRAHGQQTVIGVLRTTFRLDSIINLLSTMRFAQSGDVDLLLPAGQLLRSEGDIVPVTPSTLTELSAITARTYAVLVYDGAKKFVSRAPVSASDSAYTPSIAALNWAVIVDQAPDEAFQPIQAALLTTLVVGVIALLGGALVALLIARAFVAPLSRLSQSVRLIAAGDLGQRVIVDQRDEIGMLAETFNTMANTLEDRIAAEQVATRDLQNALTEVEARAQVQALLLAENQQQRATIREMSVPVLPISDSTLVMPLVGSLERERLLLVQSQALQALTESQARTLILDITGVPIVDSHVAQGLLAVVQAARLLGAEALLVGIRPKVAQALVSLGLQLPIQTYSDLQSALSRSSTRL